jgi:hypothetical protein
VIYASDPNSAPDTDFAAGDLRHLVAGNHGRLLDQRRTPVTVVAVRPEVGAFVVEIGAFEDAGARWELPLATVSRFQFARDGAVASPDAVAELTRAVARLDRELVIECDPSARQVTERRIEAVRQAIRKRMAELAPVDLTRHIVARTGDSALYEVLDRIMGEHGVAELDRRFAAVFVSNPGSGELVKGHAIVLAELGLCRYHGMVVRDPDLFGQPWTRARRADHIVVRLAFQRELWSSWDRPTVTLYRGAAVEGPLPAPARSSFVSATLSREVATAHFDGGPTTRTAVLWRQDVPVERLFMTFLETPAMNERFREAEAVLVADPANRAF